MACYVPFNNRNLDVSFFIFRPTVVCLDDLLLSLKQFSLYTQTLGSVHSSIFSSIHGNMIVWYGAWIKKGNENKQLLISALLSVLRNVESMAMLIDYSFFDALAGESRDGSPAAKFFTGDIVTVSSATNSGQNNNASYACLAIFKDQFLKMEGARSGVCFQSQTLPRTAAIVVWKSLQFCYTYILTSDYRNKVLPYFDDFAAVDLKYDVFRVVYVSGQDSPLMNLQFCPMEANGVDDNQVYDSVLQDSQRDDQAWLHKS